MLSGACQHSLADWMRPSAFSYSSSNRIGIVHETISIFNAGAIIRASTGPLGTHFCAGALETSK